VLIPSQKQKEVSMNKDAKTALEKENSLIDRLAKTADDFAASNATNQLEEAVLKAWAPDLLRHKAVNQNLIDHYVAKKAPEFDKQADDELAILEDFRATLASKSGFLKDCWKAHFDDDIDLLSSMK
jgi:hypothetical protein